MRILLLSTYDLHGGAAKAAFRLCEGLIAAGHEARMLVQQKSGDAEFVEVPNHFSYRKLSKYRGYLDLLPAAFASRKIILFSSAIVPSKTVARRIKEFDPDLVHMHWINKGFIDIDSLSSFNKPLAWTLHDMWAFTGGCHYAFECDRYRSGCGFCPLLRSGKANDLSSRNYLRKKSAYQGIKSLSVVTPSNWLRDLAFESGIFGEHQVLTIPNAINTDIYSPSDKIKARERLGIPPGKRLLLFNAMNAVTDERKGYNYLMSALSKMDVSGIELLLIGSDRLSGLEPPGLKVHAMGIVRDLKIIVDSYNASDLFILPTLQDNLPNTVMESLSCGVPVVAFNTGGIPDMVQHKMNGYLAEYKSVDDLKEGLEWGLNANPEEYGKMSAYARKWVLDNFSEKVVINKHIELYRNLIS